MKRRDFYFVLVAVIVLLVIIGLFHKNPHRELAVMPSTAAQQSSISTQKASQMHPITAANSAGQASADHAQRLAWESQQRSADPCYEYKLPIAFYGKVVDDQGKPIVGASVHFIWVDLSAEGTSERSTNSDGSGFFSLTGVSGKTMTVDIHKDGYKIYYASNRWGFDFSILSDPNRYYQPDAANPVTFVLRQDRPAERLEVREDQEAKIMPGESKPFRISRLEASIIVSRMAGEGVGSDANRVQVSVPDGGLQLTTAEFPSEAPLDGYEPNLLITNNIPHPPAWPWGLGVMLYVKTSECYGRVKVHYISGKPWIYVDSWFNPNPGSRNLEIDPANVDRF